jgi:hypothetical protein
MCLLHYPCYVSRVNYGMITGSVLDAWCSVDVRTHVQDTCIVLPVLFRWVCNEDCDVEIGNSCIRVPHFNLVP